MPRAKRRAYDAAAHVADLPPADMMRAAWPYLLPGAEAPLRMRWRTLIHRSPVISGQQHAAVAGLSDIAEVIGCSLCGERTMQPLFHPSAQDGAWSYRVVRCPGCGFFYRHPGVRPERLGDLYASGYSSFLTGAYVTRRRRRYELVLDAFGPLFAEGGGRRLLDFGCGAGHFLQLAHERSFDGYGVDLSPDSVEEARRHPGSRKAFLGAPLDVPEVASGGFEVITMWSVLAHLPTPVEELRMLRGLLAPGGVLLLLTVNANSLLLKAGRSAWNGFTRNHLKFFSPTTLANLLAQAGFDSWLMPPMYVDEVEAGTSGLSTRHERRLRSRTDRGNQGNMLRVAAFADGHDPLAPEAPSLGHGAA